MLPKIVYFEHIHFFFGCINQLSKILIYKRSDFVSHKNCYGIDPFSRGNLNDCVMWPFGVRAQLYNRKGGIWVCICSIGNLSI